MLDLQGFRLNVAIVLLNNRNKILLAKRINQNAWQFPQGGVNDNEDVVDALYRELREEIGLSNTDVSLIANTKHWLRYKIPARLRRQTDPLFVGQKQKWFLLRFNGNDNQIRFDLNAKAEFDDWQWVSYWYPLNIVINFKKEVYRRAMCELSHYISEHDNYQRKYNSLDPILLRNVNSSTILGTPLDYKEKKP